MHTLNNLALAIYIPAYLIEIMMVTRRLQLGYSVLMDLKLYFVHIHFILLPSIF